MYQVVQVEPAGSAALAGIRAGDQIRLDRQETNFRSPAAGDVMGATVERGGARRHAAMVAQPTRPGDAGSNAIARDAVDAALASIFPAVFGLFIAARSGGRVVPLLLSLSLLFEGNGVLKAPMWMTAPAAIWANLALGYAVLAATGTARVAFAMLFKAEGEQRLSRLQSVSLAAFAVCAGSFASARIDESATVNDLHLDVGVTALAALSTILIAANLITGWRRAEPSSRGKYALLLVAFILLPLATVVENLSGMLLALDSPIAEALTLTCRVGSGLVAPALFAYAILKNRVLDLGFAVNRTLVYGVVTVILLSTFGLIEWAVDHFVPIAGREKNVLVDAAVAVGVYLSFHRVRAFVERVIERLFFRRWQEAEAALRRFVRQAAFTERRESLTGAFMAALSQFAEGAEAALYVRAETDYRRAAGKVAGLGETIDADEGDLVALRADPRPCELDGSTAGLRAALITPMVNRNDVAAVVVLGPKPSGLPYRPDEIELIGWASQQIGLDLHALDARRLEEAAALQQAEIAELRARNVDLQIALASHRPT